MLKLKEHSYRQHIAISNFKKLLINKLVSKLYHIIWVTVV